MSFDLYSLIIFTAVFVSLYCIRLRRNQFRLPLPPGPRKLPLVGNIFDLPSTFEWETYLEWSKTYDSDILHLTAGPTTMIVLSSMEAAVDLLEKRSALYSDRPRFPMLKELMGLDSNLVLMNYGDQWRAHRKLFHNMFHAEAAKKFHPKVVAATHELLRRILEKPDGFMDHLHHMAGEVIMSVTYGIDVLPENDPYVALAEQVVHVSAEASIPGRFLVDFIPILKYVPEWFPGAGFRRIANAWKVLIRDMADKPFAETKHRIGMGNATHSFTMSALESLEDCEDREDREEVIKSAAATMYSAGSDTTVAALGTFLLAMLANPEAQKKAQDEIDSVVGHGHLPGFDDEPSLPYISALVKEVLRWKPVTPIGVPHFLPVEDEYRGYRIPAGSVVMANSWAILHDETMYPDPYAFKPERFLVDGTPNPAIRNPDAAFGFGRRICPGRHMAISSVWITVTSILATFDITKAIGEDGKVTEPSYEYSPQMIMMPLPFKCSIKPRSQRAVEMIQATQDPA
ncbi:cytochrome P450 [Mycena maculata]|uniref:Cytochrome P450 n=1 Tax=Mycena maculata TaxID=230809 RepID=A0AAD7MLX7_9AGAR|nr:cytochrome P450 [Mycena maculata]